MVKRENPLDEAIGRVIRGKYTTFGLTIEDLAERTGIPYGTLRKKLAGANSLLVVELIQISRALGHGTTPQELMDDAERLVAAMSPVSSKPDDITRRRSEKEAEARAMTPDQLAEAKSAATDDPELGTDEPEAP